MTTTNLADFGMRELQALEKLIHSLWRYGVPEEFSVGGIIPMLNRNSGEVFLTNDECQVAMLNGDMIEIWYYDFETGEEGFKDDLSPEARLRLSL